MGDSNFQELIETLRAIVVRNQDMISSQLSRRLANVLEDSSLLHDQEGKVGIEKRVSAVFYRLLFELIQSHYNTKQRGLDFRRLMKSKGCAIDDPALMENVIDILVKLYKAGQEHTDISFERSVLARFIMKELRNSNVTAKYVQQTIQTLYRCSCFDVVKKENKEVNEYKLKPHLYDAMTMKVHCYIEMIQIAQEHQIRLNPESWAYLLHNNPDVSKMQSIIDKYQTAPTVSELQQTMDQFNDKYNLYPYLESLIETQDLLSTANEVNHLRTRRIRKLIENLTHYEELYTLRQRRSSCAPD